MGCDGMGTGNKQAEKSVRLWDQRWHQCLCLVQGLLDLGGLKLHRMYVWVHVCVCVCAQSLSHSDSLQPHGLQPTRLLCPWDFPGKNTGWVPKPSSRASSQPRDWTCVLHLLHWQADSLPLRHLGSLSCCSPWVAESDTTEWLNRTLGKACLRLKWNVSKSSFFPWKLRLEMTLSHPTCLLLSSEVHVKTHTDTHTLVNLWCWKVHWFW